METLVNSEEKAPPGTSARGKLMNLDEHEASSTVEGSPTTGSSEKTEWTNEKHSMYLMSMETSFVNRLYNSLDSFGWHSRNKCSSNPKISRQKQSTSGQYKVFRNGNWTKLDISSGEPVSPRLNIQEEAGLLLASPWIKHYIPDRHHVESSPNIQEEIPIPAMENCYPQSQFHLHQESINNITEVTDQNFVDDDLESKTTRRMQGMKRTRATLVSESSSDQVVPFGKHPLAGDNAEVHGR